MSKALDERPEAEWGSSGVIAGRQEFFREGSETKAPPAQRHEPCRSAGEPQVVILGRYAEPAGNETAGPIPLLERGKKLSAMASTGFGTASGMRTLESRTCAANRTSMLQEKR